MALSLWYNLQLVGFWLPMHYVYSGPQRKYYRSRGGKVFWKLKLTMSVCICTTNCRHGNLIANSKSVRKTLSGFSNVRSDTIRHKGTKNNFANRCCSGWRTRNDKSIEIQTNLTHIWIGFANSGDTSSRIDRRGGFKIGTVFGRWGTATQSKCAAHAETFSATAIITSTFIWTFFTEILKWKLVTFSKWHCKPHKRSKYFCKIFWILDFTRL